MEYKVSKKKQTRVYKKVYQLDTQGVLKECYVYEQHNQYYDFTRCTKTIYMDNRVYKKGYKGVQNGVPIGVQKECYVFGTTQPIFRFHKDPQRVPK